MLLASSNTDSVTVWHEVCGGSAHKASSFISRTANDVAPIKSSQWSQQRICANTESRSDRETEMGNKKEAAQEGSQVLHKIYGQIRAVNKKDEWDWSKSANI